MENEVIGYSNLNIGKLRRGKVKDVYDLGDELLIFYTDRVSAFDVVLPSLIPNKGESLLKLTVYWMEKSKKIIPNHLISVINNRTIKVRKAKRIDIEWIIRKYLYGSLWREYQEGKREIYGIKLPSGLRKAEELPHPILTPTTKTDIGHDVPITKKEAIEKNIIDKDTWDFLEEISLKLYEFYEGEAKYRGLIIPDVKLEFGYVGDEIIQIDEPPTHDSARIWALKYYRIGESQEKYCLDKEFLRECLRRMGFNGEGEPPILSPIIINEVRKRCIGAYEVLAKGKNIDELNLLSVDDIFK
ncbi:MAG: phosphoribosylaminoimidazolesuccinocarboxamide synthase [Candidatus Methanomethylicia archaeon]|nr:phosphoribosylaminoimidazolesuccinocarboxamide synthase [Candidatus Methanomethylicia archaeon]